MDLDLEGRTALVTGAGSGIGAAVARRLASQGVRLAISARRAEPLQALAAEIEAAGAAAPIILLGDVTDAGDVRRIAAAALAALQRVDILVNAAGGSRPTTVDAADAIWEEAVALNFSAARRMTQALLPAMQAQGWGRVINFSGSMEPRAVNAATAAKAALHLWSKGLSSEVAGQGITVNAIAPGRAVASVPLSPGNWPRRAYVLPSRHGGRHRCRRWRQGSKRRAHPRRSSCWAMSLTPGTCDALLTRRWRRCSGWTSWSTRLAVRGQRPSMQPTRSGRRHWR